MTTKFKPVPVALLKDIESTWREASAFSNTANNLIERGLPELRALLAAPVTRQYYYRADGCMAYASTDPNCICWHDEGTGPLHNNPMTTVKPSSWREKPSASAQPDPIIGVLKSNLADGVMPSFSGGDLKHLIKLLEAPQYELAALREELERQKRYVEINANSAHGKHKEGQQYKDERDALREELAELAELKSYVTVPLRNRCAERKDLQLRLTAAEQRNADDLRDAKRYRVLRTVTPYRFKKIQDASVTDGGDVLYFHSDRFNALMDVEMAKPTESGASE